MPYRENALPPGELRRRAIEEKKALEELKYQEDLEARFAEHGDAEVEGVPGWARERFLERKAAGETAPAAPAVTPEQRSRIAQADRAAEDKVREELADIDEDVDVSKRAGL